MCYGARDRVRCQSRKENETQPCSSGAESNKYVSTLQNTVVFILVLLQVFFIFSNYYT